MALKKSEEQSSTCNAACSQLKNEVSSLKSVVEQLTIADELQGEAASSAKNFTSSTVIPYLDKAQNFLQAVSVSVNNFTNGYKSEVDTKSWSENELEEKIKTFECEINANNLLLQTLLSISGNEKKSMCKSVMKKVGKNVDSLQQCKKYYQELLNNFRKFDKSSSKYFDNLADFSTALNQGKKCVINGYTGNSYKHYSSQELNWQNEGKVPSPIKVSKHKKPPKGAECPEWYDWVGALAEPLEGASKFFEQKEKEFSKRTKNLQKKVINYAKKGKRNLSRRAANELEDIIGKAKKSKVGKIAMNYAAQVAKYTGMVPYIDDYNKRIKKNEGVKQAVLRTATSYTLHEVVADKLPEICSDVGVGVAIWSGNPEFSTGAAYTGTAVGVGLGIGVDWFTNNTIDKDVQE